MRYLQLVRVADGVAPTPDEADAEPWVEDTNRRGIRIWGDRLRPESDATTVRRRRGETIVTDGPFAEAREHIGGFDILEAADMDEAIAIAAAQPAAEPPAGWLRYVLLMGSASDEVDMPDFDEPATQNDWQGQLAAWIEDNTRRGTTVDGARLRPPEETKTVRVRDGKTLVVDGPFAEAREHVAGFDLIQAPSLDEAIEIAAAHPANQIGAIEIRPLWPM